MDSNPLIFDISSDEEAAFDELKVGDDDHGWLTELLETVDREKADSDDVVVVGEYVPPKPKSKSKSLQIVKNIDDDDDDCVVLDGDPDKPVDVVDGPADDGDDVLVVGQKGQIACRDYPHPRHLCAKFPFSSTPHDRHCDLCHCYVCDSLAPCVHWGTGLSVLDHCHATDKVEMWKSQRKESFKMKENASLSVPKYPQAHFPMAAPQPNQVAPLDVRFLPKAIQNPVYRSATIRAGSNRLNVPNVRSRSGNRQPIYGQSRNGFMPRSVPPQAIDIRSNAILRNTGHQFVASNAMFKKPGTARGASMNQLAQVSSILNSPPLLHYARSTVPLVAANKRNYAGWQDVSPNITPDSYSCTSPSLPDTGSDNVSTVIQSEVYSQPTPQSNDDLNVMQFGNQSQNVLDSGFPELDFGWINNMDPNNQHTLSENHLHVTASNNMPVTENQLASQMAGSTKLNEKDDGYERWWLGESDVVDSEGRDPADLNIFSPEPAAFDASMLRFDFETTWNSLA